MLRANSLVRKAAVRPERVADTLGLAHRDRNRGGVTATTAGGLEIEIALDKPAVLNDGDALKLEDGRLVQVRAVPESLLAVRAENPLRLTRLAWHLGGHHVPAEMTADALYVPNDPALAELVRGQGCAMTPVERPFQPEPEVHHHAHGDDCGCGHDHHHHGHLDHDHGPDHHGHAHEHKHEHGHKHEHAHGEGCGCGHDHDHHGHGHHDHGHGHGAAHGHKGHSHDH